MEGLSRVAGAPLIVKIPNGWPGPLTEGFTEYKWPPLRLEEYAVVEQHLLKNRISPVDAVLPELEKLNKTPGRAAKRLAKMLMDKAYADLRKSKATNKLSIDEVQEWIDTPEGVLFTMKLCLQRYQPKITDEEVRRIFEWLGEDEAKRLRDVAQGVDKLGNSTGPNDEAAAVEPKPQAAGLTGDGSIVGLLPSTDGLAATSTT